MRTSSNFGLLSEVHRHQRVNECLVQALEMATHVLKISGPAINMPDGARINFNRLIKVCDDALDLNKSSDEMTQLQYSLNGGEE